MLSVLTQFLSNQSQYVVVDGCRSKLVNMVERKCLGASEKCPQLFLLYIPAPFHHTDNKLYILADDSTLVAVVPSPIARE